MKRKYNAPEMEEFDEQLEGILLVGSEESGSEETDTEDITPKDWTGGGDAT